MAKHLKSNPRTLNKIILPRGYMNYLFDVLNIAKKMDSKLILDKTPENKMVVYLEDLRIIQDQLLPIVGIGSTVQDACEDYMRQIRTSKVTNIKTNAVDSFI